MPTDLSPKQKILLQIIRDHRSKYGTSPTLGELKTKFGTEFTNSIVELLKKLEEKNYIQRAVGTERGISLIENPQQTVSVRVVGSVACGKPLLAQENTEGYISVAKSLLTGDPHNYFFLRAVGDSMNKSDVGGKNIDDGDYVLIKQQVTASDNDKVVALIEDEATIKVLKRQPGFVVLTPQSSNPNNKPIILNTDFTIQGIVKAVFKKDVLVA